MKKIAALFLLVLVVLSCSSDSQDSGASDGQGGSLAVFALAGDYLYAVDQWDLNVFSLTNPSNPTQVNTKNVGMEIETLFADGDVLYIGSRNGMFMYSITNPEDPELISSVSHFTACDPVVSDGTTAYVTLHSNTWCGNQTNALMIYDITNPENPVTLNARTLVQPKGLGLYGNYLIVCDDKIKIFDVSQPAYPSLVASIDRECHDVIVRGNELFAIGSRGVYRYTLNPDDITNIQAVSSVIF
jgi:hypothetical protein